MKYLVEIKSPKVRDRLIVIAGSKGKVGKAESMPNFLLVTTDEPIEALINCTGVLAVEEDSQNEISGVVHQEDAPVWGLPWISNSGGSYTNDKSGIGVDIYIMDTGVRGTHSEFTGRVRELYSFDGLPYSINGAQSPTHGTSVAGCAAGTLYGTAKEATIVNCRIDWTNSDILKCVDTILRDHLDKPDNRPSIVNFSGSSQSKIVGKMFERLTQYGVVIVAAAGNDSEPEPRYPAKNMWVVAVGAINQQEEPAWFTNRGCDVFAPGQDIITADVISDTQTGIISGTSFACPYYVGLLACLLEGSDKFNTSSQVSSFIYESRNQLMETGRIPDFHNDNLLVRTATTNGIGGTYYANPSLAYSDQVIEDALLAMLPDMQAIADACKTYNISSGRLTSIGGIDEGQLNQLFIDNNVKPWWFTG